MGNWGLSVAWTHDPVAMLPPNPGLVKNLEVKTTHVETGHKSPLAEWSGELPWAGFAASPSHSVQ